MHAPNGSGACDISVTDSVGTVIKSKMVILSTCM